MIALFLAGGSGTRLWPLSREKSPKQLHKLINNKSLMTQTVERVAPTIEPADIWIVTNAEYFERIATNSPGVPKEQIIAEPFPLGTSLAVGLGLIHIVRQNPDIIIAIGWSDSFIGKQDVFQSALRSAAKLAPDVDGVFLAVTPSYPSTVYGYLEKGNPIDGYEEAFEIARFEEKPAAEKAEHFLHSGAHYWNPGISVWKASTLLRLFQEHEPLHFEALQRVADAIGTPQLTATMEQAFRDLDRTAIDCAIFEKAERLAMLPVDMDWSDIGSWSAIYDVQAFGDENVTRGPVVSIDTSKCLIYSQERLIATMGVTDLVIVETRDAILVAHKDDTDRLKELYDEVKTFGGLRYL